jgi:hypothetical protein
MLEEVFPREAVLLGQVDELALYILVLFHLEKTMSITKTYIEFLSDIRKEVFSNIHIKSVVFKYNNSISYEYLPRPDFDLGII